MPPSATSRATTAARRSGGSPAAAAGRVEPRPSDDAGAHIVRHRLVEPPRASISARACASSAAAAWQTGHCARCAASAAACSGVELAVELGLDQEDLVAAGRRASSRLALRAARLRQQRRARHSRDITVPIGVRGDLGDLLVGQFLQFAQHQRLAQFDRQCGDQLPAPAARRAP